MPKSRVRTPPPALRFIIMIITITIVGTAIWLMLPAYITNASAAFFGGKIPIDRGVHLCGNRLLGDGKTYEGLFKGCSAGFLCGLLQHLYNGSFGSSPRFIIVLLALSAGAMLGDIMGSFVKRRLGLRRGAPLPVVDQLDFVGGAWLLLFIVARDWFSSNFSAEVMVVVIVITPLLHLLTNFIGFKLGMKEVPW